MNAVATKTLRLKVKPEAWPWLNQAAREVNFAWNWANETSAKAAKPYAGKGRWLSGFDLNNLSAGAAACFHRINSASIQRVCGEYVSKRRQARKAKLKWRTKKSLGWVPFKSASIKRKGNALRFAGKTFRVFEPQRLDGAAMRSGQFSQSALGEWFLTIWVEVADPVADVARYEAVGLDLGLKSVATTSDGERLDAITAYRAAEPAIAQAQRRGHKRQAKRLHQRAVNQRKDALHKFTTGIVRQYQHIIVGDVSAPKLAKTRMAKSVLDSGWGMLKAQLHYKGQWAGRSVEVVNEKNTTRACSSCGQHTGPSGLRQLSVREWTCGCGVTHDRDVNAARNILALRYQRPSAGTSQHLGHGYRASEVIAGAAT